MVPTVLRHHYSCPLGLPSKLDDSKFNINAKPGNIVCMYMYVCMHITCSIGGDDDDKYACSLPQHVQLYMITSLRLIKDKAQEPDCT